MDHLKQIESFVAAVSLGSLSAVARQEGVRPAAIVGRLNALERRLGQRLLERSPQGVTATEPGQRFFAECQRILGTLALAERTVAAAGHSVRGHLRITAPAGFGRRHIAPLLPRLLSEHPQLSVALDLHDQLDALVAKNFDCAIRMGALPDSSLVSVRLADAHRVLVASPAYLARRGTPRQPADLARHDCLCFEPEGVGGSTWTFLFNGQRIAQKVSCRLVCTDGSIVYHWALAGLGLAWRPVWEVRHAIDHGDLVAVLADYEAPADGIFAVYPHRKHLPARVQAFVQMLRSSYRQPGYLRQEVSQA